MIVYFSATGNCKYVAERLASATSDTAISLTELTDLIELRDGENLGFVTPTYYWGLPSIVNKFFERVHIKGYEKSYVYYVATYGTACGQTGRFVAEHLKKKGILLNSRYSVKMPDTWTPIFDLSNPDKVAKINAAEDSQIASIINHVIDKAAGDFMKSKVPMFAVKIYNPKYENDRKTSHLHAEDSCIGCGKCARKCPVQAIEMKDKNPIWVKEQCVMCLRCLHNCPAFSIQYDNKTQNHGQYVHP